MNLKELETFAHEQHKRLQKYFNCSDKEKFVLTSTIKLTEELGELSQEVLALTSLQRKNKPKIFNKKSLSKEIADVIITTLVLAASLDVDIEKTIEDKIKEVTNTFSK